MKIKEIKKFSMFASAAVVLAFQPLHAQKPVKVGGALMYPSKNIVQNAINSKDHTTLVAAVKAAGLAKTLKSKGPFTVFAPTNEAFDMLPKGTVSNLLKPENKKMLVKILTYHVVPGKIGNKKLMSLIRKGHGKAKLKTVEGEYLTFKKKKGHVWVMDSKGNMAKITIPNVFQSNGVIHVINKVLMP